jgi:probable phosphoglycerate mutase
MRHGESVVNVARKLKCREYDGDLTVVGRGQAAKAAAWLLDKGITSIRCSPFRRAEQTAEIIGSVLGLKAIVDNDLCEIHCGDLEGRDDDEAWSLWESIYRRWYGREMTAAFPGGETFYQAHERFSRALSRIAPSETALLVTHGGITCCIVPYLCVNAAALQRVDTLSNTGFVLLEPYDLARYICHAWNLVEHMA